MFLCKQKTAYEVRISDWSSIVCSSDLEKLERWLELESVIPASWPKAFALPQGLPDRVDSYEAVELLADRLRTVWQLGTGPIRNLIDKMEEEGIKVFLTPMTAARSSTVLWLRLTAIP